MGEDLTNVIEDAVSDSLEPEVVEAEASTDEVASTEDTGGDETGGEDSTDEVASPAARVDGPAVPDEFAKKHGLPTQAQGQRENRLPYSRVKKIVENAEKKAIEPLQTQLSEFTTKVKDYEDRLTRVGEFERILTQEPVKFLEMLNQMPAYAKIFSDLQQKVDAEAPAPAAPLDDDMPQPNQDMPDGSKVYDMEGLKKLNEWNRAQAKKEALAEINKQFGPILEEREARQRFEAMIPHVQKQIDEARSWPQFKEHEDAIVEVLAAQPQMSLEGAYRQVVLPKFQTDEKKLREEIRKQVLGELKRAPSTSAPSGGVKPRPASTGKRSLEDVIKESIGSLNQ